MSGDFPAGDQGAGDGPAAIVATVPITPVEALFFDPSTRRHEMAADGTFTSIHPVDAEVVQCLHIAREKFTSVPNTGAAFWKLGSPHDPRAKSKIEDWAKQALAGPLGRGDIRLESVEFEVVGAYASGITVSYVNLRLWPHTAQSVSVPFA